MAAYLGGTDITFDLLHSSYLITLPESTDEWLIVTLGHAWEDHYTSMLTNVFNKVLF